VIHAEAVRRALQRARVPFVGSDRVIHIHCPFHADSATPSLAIYTDKLHWYCFGCSTKGSWDTLAEALNATKDLEISYDQAANTRLLRYLRAMKPSQPRLPPGVSTWSLGPWRGFSTEVIQSVHSLWWYDEASRARRVLWPIWGRDESLIGWTSRLLDKVEGAPKYRNLPRMAALQTMWPLPTRNLENLDRSLCVIVEGIPDAIRLLACGVPTISNLGTAWSDTRTLLLTDLGFREIIVSCDGDEAGRKANRKIGYSLRREFGSRIKVWDWSDSTDPGDAPQFEIDALLSELQLPKRPHAAD
jgi:DNA primase